jgi:C4-type Zn-finger protein
VNATTVKPRERPYAIHLARARCPVCASVRLKTIRSTRRGEIVTRHARCRDCGQRLFVVVE